MRQLILYALTALLAAPVLAFGHAPKLGQHGGPQTDAGSFHVEVVAQGTVLMVYVRDHSDKAVATDGFKGTAIFVIEGKPARIPLTPAGENQLKGAAPVSIPAQPKGAVQITTPTGSTVQGKFE
jgi:hypothetical protein